MTQPLPAAYRPIWERMKTVTSGENLAEIVDRQPVLLVFLRHFGCSFCREALSDIARLRASIEKRGVRIVFVHMAPERATAERFFRRYKLSSIDHISDPDKEFYRAFGLGKGTPPQLFGLMNWIRGFEAGVVEGHGFSYHSEDIGDGFQMPGVFLLQNGEIKRSYIHRYPYDRPDYEAMVDCVVC